MIETIPVGIGAVGLLLYGIIGLVRFLLADKAVAQVNHEQIVALTKRCADLEVKVAGFEAMYVEQRSLKHHALTMVAKAQMAILVVHELNGNCTCGALDSLSGILERLEAEWAEDSLGRSSG